MSVHPHGTAGLPLNGFVWIVMFEHFSKNLTTKLIAIPCVKNMSYFIIQRMHSVIQGGSNVTGTDLCVNKCKQSRSYLNHIVYHVHLRL